MQFYPSQQEFTALAQQYNIIPLTAEISSDMETPVSLYLKLVGAGKGFMLESAETGKTFGRYSFIGAQPFAEFIGHSSQAEVITEQGTQILTAKPMTALKEFLAQFTMPKLSGLPPFAGGGVGFFSYDIVATWERIRGVTLPEEAVLAQLLFCRVIAVMDHLTHTTKLIYLAEVQPDGDISQVYEKACTCLKSLTDKLKCTVPNLSFEAKHSAEPIETEDDKERDAAQNYMDKVRKAQKYIKAGDIFQVVPSQRFKQPLTCHPFSLYRRLRQINPSPYMFYLNFGYKKLVGASPELLVKVEGEKVVTNPIAGTRPRGRNEQEDSQLAAELLTDIKECAEHAMLVDLGRNDIGRISIPGSVQVERYMHIEKFSHVMHMVSEVSGCLDPKYDAIDALTACFPAGTVSGAPKVRAMEIIHELEGTCRGAYAGAVGYIDYRGNMDTCITIRTIAVEGDEAIVQAGGGIVHDSVPEKEYQEVKNKAKALLQLLAEAKKDGTYS